MTFCLESGAELNMSIARFDPPLKVAAAFPLLTFLQNCIGPPQEITDRRTGLGYPWGYSLPGQKGGSCRTVLRLC